MNCGKGNVGEGRFLAQSEKRASHLEIDLETGKPFKGGSCSEIGRFDGACFSAFLPPISLIQPNFDTQIGSFRIARVNFTKNERRPATVPF